MFTEKKYKRIILYHLILIFIFISHGFGRVGEVPGRFIIKLKGSAKIELIRNSLSNDLTIKKIIPSESSRAKSGYDRFDGYYIISTQDKSFTQISLSQFIDTSLVESVEPDYYLEFFDYPADSLFPNQWYLNNEGQEYYGIDRYDGNNNDTLVLKSGTAEVDLNLDDYYFSNPTEHTRVVVAIIDSGVDLEHPELQGQFWKNIDEIPYNGIDDDHNGYVDDTLGFDISGDSISIFNPIGDNDPTDLNGHGTHLAGLVASVADSKGIIGVNPNALIMPVKIRPNGTTSVGAEAIIYAVNSGAKVINISWGTPFVSGILNEALDYARENNVFVAVAAGNTSGTDRFYPAAFDNVFTVAAGNSDGELAYFTTYGAHIDIVSPGLDILSLRAKGTDMYGGSEPGVRIIGEDSLYILADGTSMSAPIVAGGVSLLWSIHPELSLVEIEEAIINGAVDIIDPFGEGENYPGYDTLSGNGYINIGNSLQLLSGGGLLIFQPEPKTRITTDVEIRVKPKGNYDGYWKLEYFHKSTLGNWELLSEGNSLPVDSVLYIMTQTDIDGRVFLKLTDQNGVEHQIDFIYIRNNKLEITSPSDNDILKYNIPIYGSAYGVDYDSLNIHVTKNNIDNLVFSSSGEYFDSLIYQWSISGEDTSNYLITLTGYYGSGEISNHVHISVVSAFARGWPRNVGYKAALSQAVADLNNDNEKELIVTSASGLYVFDKYGEMVDGYPIFLGKDVRCVPAIYDVDRDGMNEIIFTDAEGIHVHNYDGSSAAGWPQYCYTGSIPFGYGYPNPTVTQLGLGEDSAIVILNKMGQVMAYEFNGDSYFYSLGGLFTSMDPRISDGFAFGGSTSPFVTSLDYNGDGLYEVMASYSSPQPYTGIGFFDGHSGLPAFGWEEPFLFKSPSIFGTTLSDFNLDDLFDIVIVGYDTNQLINIWVKTNLNTDLPGWPQSLPDVDRWLGSYPVAADLDLDGIPEILMAFFEYDISYLYIFRADGTPYKQLENYPYGVAFMAKATFGLPAVANLTGDDYPEIVFRGGHILPGTGSEQIYLLDHEINLIPGWPISTPARNFEVLSSRYAPIVDDLDNDGLVELIIASDNRDILVWDFEASYDNGRNRSRYLGDNLNSNRFIPGGVPTDIDEIDLIPSYINLSQNYPNPFNPVTEIDFSLARKSFVELEVFNILGQKVSSYFNRELEAGNHNFEFDGSELASGVYLYRLKVGANSVTKKMVLLK